MAEDRRQMTTDRDQIRAWAEERNAVPITAQDPEDPYRFYHREDLPADHTALDWEEFFDAFEAGDMVFVYDDTTPAEGELGFYDVSERETVIERTDLEREEIEQSLREGKTVTTELVETRTVEAEVIETDTIESTISDTTVIDRDIIESELIDREIVGTEFLDENRIAVDIDETRLDTIEEIERLTVESEIVDVDVEERGEIELAEVHSSITDETIQRAILDSDVVRSSGPAEDILERGRIRTQRQEGEAIVSHLVERRQLEEDVRARKRLVYTVEESDLLETEILGSRLLEADLLDIEEYAEQEGITDEQAEARATGGGVEAGAGTGAGAGPMDEDAAAETGAISDEGSEAGTAGAEAGVHSLSDDDQGKEVIDEAGEQVGIVANIESEMFYIDPEPGFTDRLKARFNWGEPDQDAYPVNVSQISDVTDDEVILSGHDEGTDEGMGETDAEMGREPTDDGL